MVSRIITRTSREHVDMSRENRPQGARLLLTIANRKKLERIYRYVLDEKEFLSPHGIRALSKFHQEHPFVLDVDGQIAFRGLRAGANRPPIFSAGIPTGAGPIWFPLNFLLIESMQRIHYYYGDEFQSGIPDGLRPDRRRSGMPRAKFRAGSRIFFCGEDGGRPVYGDDAIFSERSSLARSDSVLRVFSRRNGAGLGASHQTGWTALVAKLIEQSGE